MEIIRYNKVSYPRFQSEGNAAQFAIPYAKHFCKGRGVDIGCGRKEWAFPDALPVDDRLPDNYDAMNLPGTFDYIFSSHCLEHLPHCYRALDYWHSCLRIGGVMFLYLPDYSQEYWRPWNNRKHSHVLTPEIIRDWMLAHGYRNVFVSGVDLNNSFMAVGEKTK